MKIRPTMRQKSRQLRDARFFGSVTLTVVAASAFAPLAIVATSGAAQIAFVDAQGRSWRQVTETANRSWQAIAERCPTDGVTPCAGLLGTQDLTGWIWATDAQVAELFEEFMPGIAEAGSLSGGICVLPGLGFTSTFHPTWSSYTTFGASFYVSGWTSTMAARGGSPTAFAPEVSAGYQPHHGSFHLLTQVAVLNQSQYRGAWLFLPPACREDIDRSGDVGAPDLAALLSAWGTTSANADLDADGIVGASDLSALLAAWGNCTG